MVETLRDMPTLRDHEQDYWRAFRECHRSRQGEWGSTPIAQQEMASWFDNNGIATPERAFFTEVIQSLDDEWRGLLREKRDQKPLDDGNPPSSD